MSDARTIRHKHIMVGALIAALVFLPYSVKLCHAALIMLIVNWLFEGAWRHKASIINKSLLLQLLLLLFFLQVVGLLFADNMIRGWFSLEKKIFFVAVPLALATSVIKLQKVVLDRIFGVFVLNCVLATIICLAGAWKEMTSLATTASLTDPSDVALGATEYPYWFEFSYIHLADTIGLHPTYFSLYLAVCVLLLLDALPSFHNRWLRILAMGLIVYLAIFIILLAARIVIAGACLVLMYLMVRSFMRKQRSLGMVVVAASLLSAFVLVVNPVTHYRSIEELRATTWVIERDTHYTTAAQIRLSLWWLSMRAILKANPLTGVGTGDVEKAMATTSAAYGITNSIRSFDPHNQYLFIWLANGAPACFVLILSFALPAWWARSCGDPMLVGFLFLFAGVCITECALELQKGIAFFGLMSGLMFFHRHSFEAISLNVRLSTSVRELRP